MNRRLTPFVPRLLTTAMLLMTACSDSAPADDLVVTTVAPTTGPREGGTSVTITGSGFVSGEDLAVTFGQEPATDVTFVDAQTITCTTPAGTGTVDIVVTNGDGGQATLQAAFTYVSAAPTVTGIDPARGPEEGGTAVTVTGSGFVSGQDLGVVFGQAAATDVVLVDDQTITCTTPAGTGTVDVVVTNGDGRSATLQAAFTYLPPPTVTGIDPTQGPESGGTTVTITGSGFVSGQALAVTFGQTPATDVVLVDDQTITCTSPIGAGYVEVSVTNGDGQVSSDAPFFAYGPSYDSKRVMGGTGNDVGRMIVADPTSGALYVCGSFSNTVDFDPRSDTDLKTSLGDVDIFVTKINPDGSYGWTRRMGGTGTDEPFDIDIDPTSGSIYVVGNFVSSVDFAADFSAPQDIKTSIGQQDVFVTKIGTDGSYQWTKVFSGTDFNNGKGIALDRTTGDVYVSGFFRGTVDFAGDFAAPADSKTSNGDFDVSVTKINADGTYGWTRIFGGSSDDRNYDVACSPDGSKIHLVFQFSGTIDFSADFAAASDQKTAQGQRDLALTTINSDGTYGWTKVFGGSGSLAAQGMNVDPTSGDIYLTRCFDSTLDFAGDFAAGPDVKTSAGGVCDMYLIKVQADGTYGWTHRIGGTGYDSGAAVTVSPTSGDVYVAGWWEQTLSFTEDFGDLPSYERTALGDKDAFIMKLSGSGEYRWTRVIGSTGQDMGLGLTMTPDGRIWLVGTFSETVDFAADFPEAGEDLGTAVGDRDVFVVTIDSM